jgi:hypothetical protein
VEQSSVRYTPITANYGTISDPLSGIGGWLGDGLFAGILILMLAAIAVLSPLQWQVLVLVPVIGVVAGFIGLRLYERLLHHRAATTQGDHLVSPPPD